MNYLITHKYLLKFAYLFSFPMLFYTCQNDKIIDEDKFVNVYTEMIIAQDSISVFPKDSLLTKNIRTQIRDSILNKFNVSLNQYQRTVDYYNEEPLRWQEFFDKVFAEVEKMKTEPPTQ